MHGKVNPVKHGVQIDIFCEHITEENTGQKFPLDFLMKVLDKDNIAPLFRQ